ncbi:hypothetical protein SUDANB96_05955 [Streptomyces sp. enrichment culture]
MTPRASPDTSSGRDSSVRHTAVRCGTIRNVIGADAVAAFYEVTSSSCSRIAATVLSWVSRRAP